MTSIARDTNIDERIGISEKSYADNLKILILIIVINYMVIRHKTMILSYYSKNRDIKNSSYNYIDRDVISQMKSNNILVLHRTEKNRLFCLYYRVKLMCCDYSLAFIAARIFQIFRLSRIMPILA